MATLTNHKCSGLFTWTFKCWLYAGLYLNACSAANYSGFNDFTCYSFKHCRDLCSWAWLLSPLPEGRIPSWGCRGNVGGLRQSRDMGCMPWWGLRPCLEGTSGPGSSCPVWLAFANCFTALLFHTKLLENFLFWHGLRGNLLIEMVLDAVRWGYFLLRALAKRLISGHSALVGGCVRLDSLLLCFKLLFHHLWKHLQIIFSSASRKRCEICDPSCFYP